MAPSIWYVYGIVPAGGGAPPASSLPPGIDDGAVVLEESGNLAALVSVLDGTTYGPAALETSSGDVAWLSPRAMAHDRVLTWASDRGAVVPLPMFSMFSGKDAVRSMLRDRAEQVAATLARVGRNREYALRAYRVDAELLAVIASLSPRLGEMSAAAAAASPGQRYLLERKLDAEKKTEMRAVTMRIVDDIMAALSGHAAAVVRSPIPRAVDGDAASRGTMVLNAAFLVSPEALEGFQRTLTSLVEREGAHGFRFDFTGPWPPYHFVMDSPENGDGA